MTTQNIKKYERSTRISILYYINIKLCETSRGAGAQSVTAKPTGCGFDLEMKYLLKFIFPFLCSGVEDKRGVEFCHSTRNASRIRQNVGNGVS